MSCRVNGQTWISVFCVVVVSVESREAHLSSLVVEAELRAADLAAQAQRDGLSLEACHKDKQLRAWEWRSKLYKRMKTGFQHARKSALQHKPGTDVQSHDGDLKETESLSAVSCLCSWMRGGRGGGRAEI